MLCYGQTYYFELKAVKIIGKTKQTATIYL